MRPVACPACRAASAMPLEPGVRQYTCAGCGKAYWVTVAEPVVSRTPPADSGATVMDLGEGVKDKPPPDYDVENVTTERRAPLPPRPPPPKPLAPAPVPVGQRPTRDAGDSRRRLAPSEPEQAQPGLQLGGLKLLARVGGGGMGTVWLARQMSLDRNVAVKVLRPHLGNNPAFVIQFTQEALAAAQLVHHHIAQIYDIGLDQGLHYFSMEYVDGESLAAVLKREGRLDPELAAGYVLQAARGLKFAHDRGMIHRDVKPENLLLNRDGIIKVADLGLVKRLDERKGARQERPDATVQNLDFVGGDVVMGTPQYMAPEQVLSPLAVDGRSDVYSLGCTLYDLLTGRPPFEGEATTLLACHITEAVVPPEQRNHRVPAGLSAIVLKMLGKKPDDRYADMGELIAALEKFLGVEAGVTFSPREEHAALLERAVADFNGARWAFRQKVVRLVFVALTLALVSGALALGFSTFAFWAALFLGTSALTSAVINGFVARAPVLLRLRHLTLGAPLWAWGVGFAVLGLGVGLLAWFEHLRPVLETLALAAAVGFASYLALDRRALRERRPHVHAVEEMLKGMRLKGLEEQTLRQFVCRYAGEHWEPFYEALFGFDAKLIARNRWGRDDRGAPRRRFGAWREPLVHFLDERLERRRQRAEERRANAETGVIRPPPQPAGKAPRGARA